MSRTKLARTDTFMLEALPRMVERGQQAQVQDVLFELVEDVRGLKKKVKRLERALKDSQGSQGCGGR